MSTINVYLTFNGNCLEAFEHYKAVLGGEFAHVGRYSAMPKEQGFDFPEEEKDRIMHISLPISAETVLMGSDTGGQWAAEFHQGNNFSISLSTDNKEKADLYFSGLSNNGKVIMPMQDTFWGDYFGNCIDQFGVGWMVGYKPE